METEYRIFFDKTVNIKVNLFESFCVLLTILEKCLKLASNKKFFNEIKKLIFHKIPYKIKEISKQHVNYNNLKEVYYQK